MDELILLIKEIYTKDDIGQMVPQKPGRAVWATLKSVSRAEWFKAGEMGMKSQLVAITPYVNYEGETIVLIGNDEPIEFIISIDNRNIRVGELNNLETYLKTEFCIYDDDFKITYYDSKTNYGIQLADLTVNTFYNSYKNISLVENVIKELKSKNFRVSLFPRNSRNKK